MRDRLSRLLAPPVCFVAVVFALSVTLQAGAGAAIIGFQDVSDPVKTAGWACDPASAAPVRVHLYAQTASGSRWIDSQLADKPRGDLSFVCSGAAHAFRFADYAANGTSAALYETAGAVSMRVYAETAGGLVPIAGSPRDVSFAAVGLWDPGLVDGRWRTDYSNPAEGTLAAPLLLGECPFTTPVSDGYPSFAGGGYTSGSGCRYDEILFPRSNAASSDSAWPPHRYWAVSANVEDALGNPLCTNGPPGQSLPVGAPGAGEVMGLVALPDAEAGHPERKKIHLVLNSLRWSACRERGYGGPYLAFAAHAERGNEGVVTYLNRPGAPTMLKFGMTLMDVMDDVSSVPGAPADGRRYSQAHVLVEAMWGGVKRWVFIELVPDVRESPGYDAGTVDAHVRFDWHFVDSMLHPGADYLFKSGTVLSAQCAAEQLAIPVFDRRSTYVNPATRGRARIDYAIDLQRVFACLQRRGDWGPAPMPQHPVPVTMVMFGVEQDDRIYRGGVFTGIRAPNAIWVAVDSVRIE